MGGPPDGPPGDPRKPPQGKSNSFKIQVYYILTDSDLLTCRICGMPSHPGLCYNLKKRKKCNVCKKKHPGRCQILCNNCLLPGHRKDTCTRPPATTVITVNNHNLGNDPELLDLAKNASRKMPDTYAFNLEGVNFKKRGVNTAKNFKKKKSKQVRVRAGKAKAKAAAEQQRVAQAAQDIIKGVETMDVEEDDSEQTSDEDEE